MCVNMVLDTMNNKNLSHPEYIVQRKGGGSIVDRKPVFSPDGKLLYVVYGRIVRAFSTDTGELVRDHKGLSHDVVGVQIHASRPELVVAVSEIGEMMAWRWESGIHMMTVKLRLPSEASRLTGFYLLPSKDRDCDVFATWTKQNMSRANMSVFSSDGKHKIDLNFSFDNNSHSVAFACGQQNNRSYVVATCQGTLYSIDVEKNKGTWFRLQGNRVFTCVACHPSEICVATGDNSGRILIWRDILDNPKPPNSVYHWHTLPVADVIFSQSGSFFFSGGQENVLVKWRLDSPLDKSYLPRLPAPICHLNVSKDNVLVAVSTLDNGIQLVNMQKRITKTIQYFSWGVQSSLDGLLFPAGLNFDSRSHALVLNGRTGHIQFYDPLSHSIIYNLDITGLNFITPERKSVIVNTEVVIVALSSCGQWLSTVECFDNGEINPQVTLKFYHFNSKRQQYSLNTSIQQPHEGKVHALKFQSMESERKEEDALIAVTTGADLKFRIWALQTNDSIYTKGGGSFWMCRSVAYYRDLPAGDVAFSVDGSVMGISFGPSLTLWDPDNCTMKCSLTPTNLNSALLPIRFVEFGSKECCHLVVVGTSEGLSVWNILSLSLIWTAPFELSVLKKDPCSGYMAAFSSKNTLFIFSPHSPEPVLVKEKVCPDGANVLSAIFVPRLKPRLDESCLSASDLYFIDSNQELLALQRSDEVSDTTDLNTDSLSESQLSYTPFRALQAEQSTSKVYRPDVKMHSEFGIPGRKELNELLSAPCHTLPPVHLLCGSLLNSLVVRTSPSAPLGEGEGEEPEPDTPPRQREAESDSSEDGEETLSRTEPPQSQSQPQPPALTDPDLEQALERVLNEPMKWARKLLSR